MEFNLERVLRAHPAMFGKVMENADADADGFNLQILLSEVSVDEQCRPCLIRHGFRADESYFYPASAIKLCAAVAALQKLDHLTKVLGKKMSCTAPLAFHSLEHESQESCDMSNQLDRKITVAHEIRKLFLVSDNRAFNRLYDLVGHRSLNQAMWDLGLQSTRLQHHLSFTSSSSGPTLVCSPVEVDLGDGTFATLPPKRSRLVLHDDNPSREGLKIGTGHITGTNELVNGPMDFSGKNRMSLLHLQDLLVKIIRTDIEMDEAPLKLDESSRMLLMEAMAQCPADSCNPQYERNDYPDDYCKLFLPGLCRVRPKGSFRIYNKIGRAYGYTTDNAYIFDLETARSFFLSATVYTNANGIIGDDQYEYEIADKLLANIGEVMARAIWKLPPPASMLLTPLDGIPSSLWPQQQQQQQQQAGNKACSTSTEQGQQRKQEQEQQARPVAYGFFLDE